MKKVLSRWYLLVIGGFLLAAMAVFLLCGEDSVIACLLYTSDAADE